ncbi:MAG: hypothetical protein IPG17_29130 [Sandaracinaceae bacterium]|nr:hypothetical protein [Sandaracinaceae bacterium]
MAFVDVAGRDTHRGGRRCCLRARVGELLTVPMHVTNTSAADATYGLRERGGMR